MTKDSSLTYNPNCQLEDCLIIEFSSLENINPGVAVVEFNKVLSNPESIA